MKKILIADDHAIVRTGVSILVRQEYLNAQIDECYDGDSAWKKIESERYDICIMDITMPGTDSINLLSNIFNQQPQLKILILTMSSEEIYARKYFQLGVKGFINKEAESAEIRKAIVTVMNGKKYMSQKLQELIARDTVGGKSLSPFESLSARELEVMTHLIEGKNVSEIADVLSVHTSTIGTHKARIMQKLGVNNIIELNKMVKLFSIS